MKDSLLLPVVFLLLLILCFALFSLGYLMYLWVTQYVPSNPPSVQWALGAAPGAMRAVFVPSTFVALFVVIMRVARKPGVPFFSYLFALASVAAVFYFGLIGAARFLPGTGDAPPGTSPVEETRAYNPLVAGHFNLIEKATIYPGTVTGDSLGPTFIVDPSSRPAFTAEREGVFDPKTGNAVFADGKKTVPIHPVNPNFAPELAPRNFLASLFGDMKSMSSFLETARGRSRVDFLIALGGMALFSVACMGLAWITRWPLMNVVLVAISFRGLFWLFTLFTNTVATDAFALVVPKRFMPVAPAIGLAALGVIFILWTIFFIRPPARD